MTYSLMLVADVLKLPSVDYGVADCRSDLCSAEDVIASVYFEDYHEGIRQQMIKDGLNAVPIHVASVEQIAIDYHDKAFLYVPSALGMGNGHHRLKLAVELDFMYILTSDDIMDSGEADDPVMSLDEVDLYEKMGSLCPSALFILGVSQVANDAVCDATVAVNAVAPKIKGYSHYLVPSTISLSMVARKKVCSVTVVRVVTFLRSKKTMHVRKCCAITTGKPIARLSKSE
jgi:hypothetical protein